MHRCLFGVFALVGLLAGLAYVGEASAQSKKKLGGPVVMLDGMKSQVYEFWKPAKADKPYEYKFMLPQDLKSDKDAAELVVYEVTGKADDVIADWKKHFEASKGFDLTPTVSTFKVGGVNVTKLIIRGTYLQTDKPDDPISKAKKVDDIRLLGFVFEGKGKKYAIRLVGVPRTTGIHLNDVEGWVKAFK